MSDLVGTVVGGSFRVTGKIAEGGMGTVYRAVDEKLDRPVALKVIKPTLARSPEFAERFAREAKALASVLHPALATIFAFGEDEGLVYMALELVEGEPLHEVIFAAGCVLPVRRAVSIAAQTLDGLAAIHDRGIFHRDLKPPNIMVVTRSGRDHVKLVDFGLVKLQRFEGLTDPNILIGTPTYMSPEQARGDKIDARSDLYAVGIVIYEMLTGVPPFEAPRVHELLEKQARATPQPPSFRRQGIPVELEALVLRALAKDPADRPQSADEFATALRSLSLVEAPAPEAPKRGRTGPSGTPIAGGATTPTVPTFE